MQNDSSRPVACVTGATRGIGNDIAQTLAANGYDIAFGYRNEADAGRLTQALEAHGAAVYSAPLDLNSFDSIDTFFTAIDDRFGRLDVLVNNAGITRDGLLASMPIDDLQSVINVNLISPMLCAQAAVKVMIPNKRGAIINISSISATKPNRGQTSYAASKGGIEGFTRALAVEVAKKNIRVNAIAPGVIVTDMVSDLLTGNEAEIKGKLLSKRFGEPSDISRAVLFLADPANAFITGEVLPINGGMLLK